MVSCLTLKEAVTVSGFWNKSAAAERDDLCDGLLAASYPYISEARGWTDSTSRTEEGQLCSIRLDYLPGGEENRTSLYHGVRYEGREAMAVSRARLWRHKGEFCGELEDGMFSSLSQEDNLVSVKLEKVATAVIASTDRFKEEWTTGRLGTFKFQGVYNGAYYFSKKGVKKGERSLYLFRGKDKYWWVDSTLDGWGMARNKSLATTVPQTDWECWQLLPEKWVPWHVTVTLDN